MGTEETQQVRTTETIPKGKTVISFTKDTPMWATWIFRIEFFLNKGIMMYLAGTPNTIVHLKNDILILGIVDFMVWGLAKSIGVKKSDLGLEDSSGT